MSKQYVSPITQMIVANGVSFRMVAGVPATLPGVLIGPAMAKGAVEQGGDPSTLQEQPSRVPAVVAAIRELMTEGDEKAFSKTTGEPSLTALRRKTGFQVTDPERDAAWAQVKTEG